MVQKKKLTSLEVDRGVWGAEPPSLTAGLFVSFVWNGTERNIWNGTGWNGYVMERLAPERVGTAVPLERLARHAFQKSCFWNGTERIGTAIPCNNAQRGGVDILIIHKKNLVQYL